MCGIVGGVVTNISDDLIDCLKFLEYRGYDSAGVATLSHDSINCTNVKEKSTN